MTITYWPAQPIIMTTTKKPLNLPFTQWLKEARKRRGFTQDELADTSGVDQGLISKYERGVMLPPKSETVMALAKGLTPEGAGSDFTQRLYQEGLSLVFGLDIEYIPNPDTARIIEAYTNAPEPIRRTFDALAQTVPPKHKSAAEIAEELDRAESIGKRA